MCVVRQEKVPKLQTACTTTVAEGQVFITESPEIAQARKATIELLLGNHPLDCPVCDAGGECELQDMTFKYGAGESLYVEAKHHRDEQQWSPAVFYDRPRCILCYRCIRMCGEGMDVWALGMQNRGVSSVIAPNDRQERLDCEQCGMCIDVCPVGALTSGSYRYKTRPWEMNHVSTVCTHCADGCKVTLGVRQANDGSEIVRADNRDKSGINGDFLCAKGRFGFDFVESPERLTTAARAQLRRASSSPPPGSMPSAWPAQNSKRFATAAAAQPSASSAPTTPPTKRTTCCRSSRARFSKPTTSITSAPPTTQPSPAPSPGTRQRLPACATLPARPRFCSSAAIPTDEHPLLAWMLRTNVRLNRARLYIANAKPIKLERQAKAALRLLPGGYSALAAFFGGKDSVINNRAFREAVLAEENARRHLRRGVSRQRPSMSSSPGASGAEMFVSPTSAITPIPAALPTWASSRSAPRLCSSDCRPAHSRRISRICPPRPAKPCRKCLSAAAGGTGCTAGRRRQSAQQQHSQSRPHSKTHLSSFRISSSLKPQRSPTWSSPPPASTKNPAPSPTPSAMCNWCERPPTAPASSPTSKFWFASPKQHGRGREERSFPSANGGVTADLGQSRGAQSGEADRHAVWLAANGLEPKLSPFDPLAVLDEIERLVPGYKLDRLNLFGGNEVHTEPGFVPVSALTSSGPDLVVPAHDGLFTSGTLGRYSTRSNELEQHQAARSGSSAEQRA